MKQLKEIVSNNRMCKFSQAIAGILYYKVETDDSMYMFPINMNDRDDVGTATFECDIKAITLMRYIRKAIELNCLIKIK